VNEISGSRGCDYEKFYGLGIWRCINWRIFVLASEETITIINRVNRRPQIPFKVRGLERVKNTAERNNGVICHISEHCSLHPTQWTATGAPRFFTWPHYRWNQTGWGRRQNHVSPQPRFGAWEVTVCSPQRADSGSSGFAVHHALKTYGRVKA
jgi:hypothetical protein